jgi:glycosyltransferase involved in cell wall biosynthesis
MSSEYSSPAASTRRVAGLPTVSVIIPSMNAARYIRAAIDSVLAQTHPILEVIVVDGGSTDGTQEAVLSYGAPVTLVDQRKSGRKGIAAGRNVGIEFASGDWVAFLDADDWWDARKIAEQYAALGQRPGAALNYTGVWVVEDQSGERQEYPARLPETIWPSLRWRNQIGASTVLVKRAAIVDVGAFREDLIGFEDWEMWVRLRLKYQFTCCRDPLSFYRILPQSVSHDVQKHLDGIPQVCGSTMVTGLTGWQRWVVGQRLWAAQLYGAVSVARENGESRALSLMWSSLAHWPFPTFLPIRYKVLLVMLLRRGRHDKVAATIKH